MMPHRLHRGFVRLLLWSILVPALVAGLTVAGLTAAGPAVAAPDLPTAIRVRVAHLAPYPGSSAPDVTVTVGGVVVATELGYSDRTEYQTLALAPGDHAVEVLRSGSPVATETVSLIDGDQSLIFIGVEPLPLTIWHVDDNSDTTPPADRGDLRFGHVAAIGLTADATKVDICSQDGVSFQQGADPLRYARLTTYKQLKAMEYSLKMTRDNDGDACSGEIVIDPPPWVLLGGVATTFYLVGDAVNQDLAGFTFTDGLIGADPAPPPESKIMIPALIR